MSEVNQFKFEGTIQKVFETKQGTTQKGDQWKAVEFLVTEKKEYPQSAVFKIFGSGDKLEKVDNFLKYQKVGDDVTVSFNLKTSEYNGKTYNGVEAWSVFGKKADVADSIKANITTTGDDDSPF